MTTNELNDKRAPSDAIGEAVLETLHEEKRPGTLSQALFKE